MIITSTEEENQLWNIMTARDMLKLRLCIQCQVEEETAPQRKKQAINFELTRGWALAGTGYISKTKEWTKSKRTSQSNKVWKQKQIEGESPSETQNTSPELARDMLKMRFCFQSQVDKETAVRKKKQAINFNWRWWSEPVWTQNISKTKNEPRGREPAMNQLDKESN